MHIAVVGQAPDDSRGLHPTDIPAGSGRARCQPEVDSGDPAVFRVLLAIFVLSHSVLALNFALPAVGGGPAAGSLDEKGPVDPWMTAICCLHVGSFPHVQDFCWPPAKVVQAILQNRVMFGKQGQALQMLNAKCPLLQKVVEDNECLLTRDTGDMQGIRLREQQQLPIAENWPPVDSCLVHRLFASYILQRGSHQHSTSSLCSG